MKAIFESVIKKGGYDLAALLAKIDTYHIEGKISDSERDELYTLARVKPQAQFDHTAEIQRLWAEIKVIKAKLEAEEDTGADTETEETTVPEYKQPTGAHDAYMTGDVVKYNGEIYKSVIDNNVWNPDVYPNGWEKEEQQ